MAREIRRKVPEGKPAGITPSKEEIVARLREIRRRIEEKMEKERREKSERQQKVKEMSEKAALILNEGRLHPTPEVRQVFLDLDRAANRAFLVRDFEANFTEEERKRHGTYAYDLFREFGKIDEFLGDDRFSIEQKAAFLESNLLQTIPGCIYTLKEMIEFTPPYSKKARERFKRYLQSKGLASAKQNK